MIASAHELLAQSILIEVEDLVIEVKIDGENSSVEIGGKEVEILDGTDECLLAECDLTDLSGESGPFPAGLQLEVHSEDGFGTYFFHELLLSHHPNGTALEFRCHTPNKYWEGRFGLATFVAAVRDQARHLDGWEVTQIETEDDWKGITLQRVAARGDPIHATILASARELVTLLQNAEIALSGVQWTQEFSTDEDRFCRELLYPLLRRMGFLFVRYTHGKKEYGKDFTFSELTPFGTHRHYGLQAKAGDVRSVHLNIRHCDQRFFRGECT